MPTFKRADQEQMEKAQDLLEGSVQELGFAKSLYFGRLKLDEVMPYPRQDIDEAKHLHLETLVAHRESHHPLIESGFAEERLGMLIDQVENAFVPPFDIGL